ncbi:MAG: carboxypeptidase M32 [Pseudomonadota bacterium]
MAAYDDLMAFVRQTEALSSVAGRTGWDQETMMPKGAAAQRGEEMGALEAVLHARRCDPRIGDWLEGCKDLGDIPAVQVREIRRSYDRAVKMPADLAVELARITSVAQGEWAAARAVDDWPAFQGRLSEIIALKREEAAALADGGDLYDALLQDYEPGITGDEIAALFDVLRARIVALREDILGRDITWPEVSGTFDETAQLALSQELAVAFGYDLSRGRIDKAVHPFSSGSGNDVRITTRTDPGDPFNCLYSTIHEVGHACYEQNVDQSYALTPIGRGASMGVHESQSRIYENQLARSEAFCCWLFGRMRDRFGDFGIANEAEFFHAVNRVTPGHIRTEADEVHYNLHVMLRFDLERDLISGALEVADLEAAWNARFAADFGLPVERPSQGVLQDVHWSVGLFGYFPTYTLGNVYAGCLHQAMRGALPNLDAHMANGDVSAAVAWLRDGLQLHGSRFEPKETIEHACGANVSAEPLLGYLDAKFGAV